MTTDVKSINSKWTQSIASPPSEYRAYLYRWINRANDMIYLGKHNGSVDDTYRHSSTNTEFNKVYSDPASVLHFEVFEYGTEDYIQNREHQELSAVNAISNEKYYNKSNGSPTKKTAAPLNEKAIEEFVNQIEAQIWPVQLEEVEEHVDMPYLQVRDSHDPEHQDRIRDRINDHGIQDTDPVIVLLDYPLPYKNGILGKYRIDGNHTVFAIGKSKNATQAKVMNIPKCDWQHLTPAELESVALGLNNHQSLYKDNSAEDALRYLRKRVKEGHSHKSAQIIRIMKEVGFSSHDINAAKTKINKEIKENSHENTSNWIKWTSDAYKKILKKKINHYKNDDVGCLKVSSAAFRIGNIIEYAYDIDVHRVHVLIHHPDRKAKEKWEKTVYPKWQKMLPLYLNKSQLQVTFKVLPSYEDDVEMIDFK